MERAAWAQLVYFGRASAVRWQDEGTGTPAPALIQAAVGVVQKSCGEELCEVGEPRTFAEKLSRVGA